MAEIFRIERPGDAMAFTGERLTTAIGGQIEIEHLHRYFLVRSMVRDKDVLDIACGEGYGAAIIAQVARSTVGMDVSPEAVAHAERAYARPNLSFRVADARHIDAPDASFDVVSSFETLEHIYEHESFYAEIKRVLRPGGILVISTPDRTVYSPDGSTANPFHVRELDRSEYEAGLAAMFRNVMLLLQRPMLGSLMLAAKPEAAQARGLTFEQRGPNMFEANEGLPRALYLVAIASDLPVSPVVATAYVETSQLAVREAQMAGQLAAKDAEAARLLADKAAETARHVLEVQAQGERMLAHHRAQAVQRLQVTEAERADAANQIRDALEDRDRLLGDYLRFQEHHNRSEADHALIGAERNQLRDALDQLRADLNQLQAERGHLQDTLGAIVRSRSWRVTAPLRAVLRLLRPAAGRPAASPTPSAQAPSSASGAADGGGPALPPAAETAGEHADQQGTVPEQALVAEPALAAADKQPAPSDAAPPDSATPIDGTSEPVLPQPQTAGERLRQRQALGTDLDLPALSVAVGVVTYDTSPDTLSRCLASIDLARKAGAIIGETYVIDNGTPSAAWPGNRTLPSHGNIGFGRGHNVLMREAFASGADVYVATNPDGAFHPGALENLVRVVVAHGGRALVEACQFPAEHPKHYDPITLDTPWVSGACLAIPRCVFEETHGFDDAFFMYCEDVDLSWRARAAGFKALMAPNALFLHPVTNRTNNVAMWKLMLSSAVTLGRKWGNAAFAEHAATNLAELGEPIPDTNPATVPEAWRAIPDFTRGFSFAAIRW